MRKSNHRNSHCSLWMTGSLWERRPACVSSGGQGPDDVSLIQNRQSKQERFKVE